VSTFYSFCSLLSLSLCVQAYHEPTGSMAVSSWLSDSSSPVGQTVPGGCGPASKGASACSPVVSSSTSLQLIGVGVGVGLVLFPALVNRLHCRLGECRSDVVVFCIG
jgi:hypothetical protein